MAKLHFQNINKFLLYFIMLIFVFWGIVTYRSNVYYYAGIKAESENKILDSITFYERSALWYSPFNPFVFRARERLRKIAFSMKESKSIFSKQAINSEIRIYNQIYPWRKGSKLDGKTPDFPIPLYKRILMHFAFIVCLIALMHTFFKGFTDDGKIRVKPAASFFTLSVASFIVWLYLLQN